MKKFLFQSFILVVLLAPLVACSGDSRRDFLRVPTLVAVDSVNGRIFVVDERQNRLNLILSDGNEVQGFRKDDKEPLLDQDEVALLPAFPRDLVVFDLGGGVSRLLVLGFEANGAYVLRALDYDGGEAISEVAGSPFALPSGAEEVYGALILESSASQLWVTEPNANQVHILDRDTLAPVAASPLALGALPQDLSWDQASGMVAVSQAGETFVSLIDTNTFGLSTLDLGFATKAVALVPGEAGALALVALALEQNRLLVYQLDLGDLTASTLLLDLVGPTVAEGSSDLITGSLEHAAAGTFVDGRPAAFVTQSSGDLLRFVFDPALSTVTSENIVIGAGTSGEIAFFPQNTAMERLYFSSSSAGLLNVLDPDLADFTSALVDQIP